MSYMIMTAKANFVNNGTTKQSMIFY